MKNYVIAVMAGMFAAGAVLPARAQSPWETGGFHGYSGDAAPADPNTPSGDGGLGLQGFSLAPPTGDSAEPPAPTYRAPAQPQLQYPVQQQSSDQATQSPAIGLGGVKAVSGVIGDPTFLVLAQQSIDSLVQSSQLAQKNATTDMQQFADQIVSIYGGMRQELALLEKKENLAAINNVTLPNGIGRLKDKSGVDFNKQYMQIQMQEFNLLASAFRKEADNGQNPELKAFAASHIATVDQQKAMVQQSYMNLIGQGAQPMGASR